MRIWTKKWRALSSPSAMKIGYVPILRSVRQMSLVDPRPTSAALEWPLELVRRPERGPATARARPQAQNGAPRHDGQLVRSRWPICFKISLGPQLLAAPLRISAAMLPSAASWQPWNRRLMLCWPIGLQRPSDVSSERVVRGTRRCRRPCITVKLGCPSRRGLQTNLASGAVVPLSCVGNPWWLAAHEHSHLLKLPGVGLLSGMSPILNGRAQ